MAQYFSAFRVDHILGFFRIYEVPDVHVTGALGHFRPSLPLWKSDLEAHGLWDLNRLTEPYITRELVREHLGALADDAAAKYLEPTPSGMLRFKVRDFHPEIARFRPEISAGATVVLCVMGRACAVYS